MLNPGKESRIGCLILSGIPIFLVGLAATLMLAGGGALRYLHTKGSDKSGLLFFGVGIVVALGGIGMTLAGIVLGLRAAKRPAHSLPVESAEDCRIIARFSMNRQGEMLFDLDPDSTQELRHFVQVLLADGRRAEFKCAPEVFFTCGEGMKGLVEFQGDWLGRFTPAPRVAPNGE